MIDFPLAALVGQEQLKTALLLCAVNPGIGGVLIRGDKGSAKSTAARGLAAVMPPIERVLGCAYNCPPGAPTASCEVCNGSQRELDTTPVPFVNLPLGAGEDRVLGSLDFERALKDGRKAFQPGLLASAHRGILYIDEVNLLPDHLVDVLLDTAAMGVNRVQREGLSVQHPARIALVGTMNQEEGELRPQLLDRFGLMVEVRAPQEPRLRAEIVRRRLAWEGDPDGFVEAWGAQQLALREQVLRAQALLPQVTLAEGLLVLISELCCSQNVTSLRADLVMNKAARALAALQGRTSVEPDDLSEAAMLVLPHRRRSRPFEEPSLDEDELRRVMNSARSEGDEEEDSEGAGEEQVFAPGVTGKPPRIETKSGAVAGGVVGRRSVAVESRRGGDVRAVPDRRPTDLAVTATLHHSLMRTGGRLEVAAEDLHQKVRAGRQGALILFVVDSSGSMAALKRMEMVKATVLSLLRDAYERRDEVGVIVFRGTTAQLLLSPTRSVDMAERQLRELPTGGRTPLAHALQIASDTLKGAKREPLLIVLSDGKANVPIEGSGDAWQQVLQYAGAFARKGIAALVLDTEVGFVRMGRAQELADALGAQCLSLEEFTAESLSLTIRKRVAS
jgi:magnesium chelatase subunit D